MKKLNFYIWEGVFKNFKEALKKKKGFGFSGNIWREDQTRIIKFCKQCIKKNKKIPNSFKKRNTELKLIIENFLDKKRNLKILDIGGGYGIAYYILREAFQKKSINFDYTILEIPKVCIYGKKLSPNIKFIKKIKNERYDLVYSSSTIQYFNNWKLEIKKLINIQPKFIFLTDIFAGKIPTFVSLQRYYDSTMPHWFINFDEFNEIFKNNGYKLKIKKKTITTRLNYKNRLPMENFESKYILNNTLTVLYEKQK